MTQLKHILLVEDDPEMRRIISAYLDRETWEVHEAETEAQAIRSIEAGMTFDLALLDFCLGASTAISVMDRLEATPMIVISGGSDRLDLEKIQAISDVSGAVNFLQKPFRKSDLVEIVQNALTKS